MDNTANAWLRKLLQHAALDQAQLNSQHYPASRETADRAEAPNAESLEDMNQLPPCVYESTVNLSSGGRTHQIRAQMAAAGAPLIGDVMYGPISGMTVGSSGVAEPDLVQRIELCQQIDGNIGLHAYSMVWNGRTFQCLPPWAE